MLECRAPARRRAHRRGRVPAAPSTLAGRVGTEDDDCDHWRMATWCIGESITDSPTHHLADSPSTHTRDWYSPVSVFTRTLSPSLTNGGTLITRPVSSVAGFTCALAVAPLMPGTVSLTSRSTVAGSSMPTGSTS